MLISAAGGDPKLAKFKGTPAHLYELQQFGKFREVLSWGKNCCSLVIILSLFPRLDLKKTDIVLYKD